MTVTTPHPTTSPSVAAYAALLLAGDVAAAALPAQVPLDTTGSATSEPWTRYGDWPDKDYRAFNTLSSRVSPPQPDRPVEITAPVVGDVSAGKELAFDRSRGGSCVACHVMGPDTPELPGNVGPDLSLIGNGGRSDTYLYNYVRDARVYNPATVMPPWGTNGLFDDGEIRNIVAFLKSLTTPARFSNPLDNPANRPPPKEERDNLDPLENPAMQAVEDGTSLFARVGSSGKSCASCHASPETAFRTWGAQMPKYSPTMKKVLGVEEFVTRHGRTTTGDDLAMQSDDNTALSVYLRYLANGTPIAVGGDDPGERQALAQGEKLMRTKIGQLNFACMDCHAPDKGANKWIRGQWLGESRGQTDHFPTWRTSRAEIWDIRKRFQWCNVAVRANELPPDAPEYGAIELYLNTLNAGLPLSVPGIRH